jgi:hypothetical protein
MGMVERGHRAGFPLEAFGKLLARDLNRDDAVESRVSRAVGIELGRDSFR